MSKQTGGVKKQHTTIGTGNDGFQQVYITLTYLLTYIVPNQSSSLQYHIGAEFFILLLLYFQISPNKYIPFVKLMEGVKDTKDIRFLVI